MISVICPIPFGGAHHFFSIRRIESPCFAVKTSKSLISRSGHRKSVPIFRFKTESNAAQNGGVALQHLDGIKLHFQFHQTCGHVIGNIQSSSFASLMSLPCLHLLEFQRLILSQKFLVPVLTWHGLSRVLHDPPDVW